MHVLARAVQCKDYYTRCYIQLNGSCNHVVSVSFRDRGEVVY